MQTAIWCITGFLCLLVRFSYSQPPVLNPTPTTLSPLNIGDRVPDIVLTKVYNYKSETIPIQSFRGKLLLLDFWATYCAACVKKMDHMEQLVNRYPSELAVLLVSQAGKADTRYKINAFFDRVKNNAGQRYQLPVVVNDTLLSKFFPNKYLPHLVWINGEQRVIAITGSEAVTAENIRAVLDGKLPVFSLKEDQVDFKPASGLFKNGNGGSGNNFLFRTIITPNVLGIPSSSSIQHDESGKVVRISHANAGLLFLLNQSIDSDLPFSHIDMSKAGWNLDYRGKDANWIVNNSYCYELVVPPTTYPAAKRMMQQDLERYFGLNTNVRPVMSDCYVLKADTVILSRYISKGGKSLNTLYDKSGKQLRNYPAGRLSEYLDAALAIPVVDETKYSFSIDIDLPDKNPLDVDVLNNALFVYGLRLEPAKRVQTVLFITHLSLKPTLL